MATALLQRLVDGRTDLVHDWLAAGGAATATDAHGTSLLAWCAWHGDVSAMRLLLAHGASLEQLGANFDLTGAAFHGHWPLLQFLLESGADPRHAQPDTGETALHAALSRANRPGRIHLVRLLLAAGADPQARTIAGASTGMLMRDARCRGETALHRAAAFADPDCIEALTAAGADVQARDAHGDTPLSWASWHLRPPAVLRLLCFGPHRIHPDNRASYDHGQGWSQLDPPFNGRPHG